MRSLYDNIVKTLAPHVDIFLCETLSSSREAQAAATAAKRAHPGSDIECEHGSVSQHKVLSLERPVWVALTLEDDLEGKLRGGERLDTVVLELLHFCQPEALLVNCCAPRACTAAMEVLCGLVPPSNHPPTHLIARSKASSL